MSQTLAQRQNQALRRGIHGHVGRLLNDVKAFEVHAHGMGRIRQPAVRESVSGKKIAEFVMPGGLGNAENRNQSGSRSKNQQPDEQHAQRFSSRQSGKPLLQGLEGPGLSVVRFRSERRINRQRGKHQDQFDDLGTVKGARRAMYRIRTRICQLGRRTSDV